MELIALDMDGTLLDGNGQLPAGFDDVARACADRGWVLAPASGRQLATLQRMFDLDAFIAENGTVVSYRGEIVTTPLSHIDRILASVPEGCDVVVCHPERALVKRVTDEIRKYYAITDVVDTFQGITEEVVKIAVYAESAVDTAPLIDGAGMSVVVSGPNWVDIMNPQANKGTALRMLAEKMGADATMAFGDYFNDLEMLRAADRSFAVANAHPDIRAVVDEVIGANTESGVLVKLRELTSRP